MQYFAANFRINTEYFEILPLALIAFLSSKILIRDSSIKFELLILYLIY